MSESTLSMTKNDLRVAVGYLLGFGTQYSDFSSDLTKVRQVDFCIKSGLRMFYNPPPLPGEKMCHSWSFLHPIKTIQLFSGVIDYDLPDDWGGFYDNIVTLTADTNQYKSDIKIVSPSMILKHREAIENTVSGRPEMVAEVSRKVNENQPSRYQLMVWPEPNQDYTIRFIYRSNPFDVSDDNGYPFGGQPHAETLRSACLAAAERDVLDQRGIHYASFMERLIASVEYDRTQHGPKSFGYNDNKAGRRGESVPISYVFVNGVLPT